MKKYMKLFLPAIFMLVFFILIPKNISHSVLNNDEVMVHFINVGQGDSILISSNNYNILIDGGPEDCSSSLKNYLRDNNIKKLDFVIATHPHEDHIGSIDSIIDKTTVSNFIAPAVVCDTQEFSNMVNSLKRKNLKIQTPRENLTIKLDTSSHLAFYNADAELKDDNLNNSSLVVKFVYKNISFLFTGDIEAPVEKNLIINNKNMDSNVLKVAHHGSSSSSTSFFLQNVSPSIAIISCGMGNDYGHPDKSTLNNLENIKCRVFRTDTQGNIILRTDGYKISAKTEK